MSKSPASDCTGKKKLTVKEARHIARDMNRREQGTITAYRCQYCGGWHVGSRSSGVTLGTERRARNKAEPDRSGLIFLCRVRWITRAELVEMFDGAGETGGNMEMR